MSTKKYFVGAIYLLLALEVYSQDRSYNVYLDQDRNSSTGCIVNQPDLATSFNGIDGYISVITTPPPASISSSIYIKCNSGVFDAGLPLVEAALGLNTGENDYDVFEVQISTIDLGIRSSTQARLFFTAESAGSTDIVIANNNGGTINIGVMFAIPTLSMIALLLLTLFFLIIAKLTFRNKILLSAVVVLYSSSLWAMFEFVIDGQIDDWSGINAIADDPIGDQTSAGDFSDIAKVYAILDQEKLVVRMDVVDVENTAPSIISANAISVLENQTSVINVEATDPEGDTENNGLTYAIGSSPDFNFFNIDANTGVVTFVNPPDFESPSDLGSDNVYNLTIIVTDSEGLFNTQNIAVTVTDVEENQAPIAIDDEFTTDEDTILAGNVFAANPGTPDSDPNGDLFTIVSVNGSVVNVGVEFAIGFGLITINTDGNFSFSPNNNYEHLTSTDTSIVNFTYQIDDGTGLTSQASVIININGVNDAPIAINDDLSTDESSVLNANVLAANPTTEDSDPEGDSLTVTSVNGNPANVGVQITMGFGLLAANEDGTISFDPNGGYEHLTTSDSVVESFTYQIDDGSGLTSQANVSINITGINDAPNITSTNIVDLSENQNFVIDVASLDPEGETEFAGLNYSIIGNIDDHLFNIDTISGEIRFILAADFENPNDVGSNNIYELQVRVTDSSGLSDTQDILITVTDVNEAPTAVDDYYLTDEDTDVIGNILTRDSDPDSNVLSVVSVNGNAALVDTQFAIGLGLLTINVDGSFIFSLNGGYEYLRFGLPITESFVYEIDDGFGLTSQASVIITITGINDAPSITSPNQVTVSENQNIAADIDSSDPEGETEGGGLTYMISGGVDSALFNIDVFSGIVFFQSLFDFESPIDSDNDNIYEIQVRVTDTGGLSSEQDIAIRVTNANDAPTPVDDTFMTDEDTNIVGNLLDANPTTVDSDPENDQLTIVAAGNSAANIGTPFNLGLGMITINSDGSFIFSPEGNGGYNFLKPGESRLEAFSYEVSDGSLVTPASVRITITGVNDAPSVFAFLPTTLFENQTFVIDMGSSDPEGETEGTGLTYSLTGAVDDHLFSIDPNTGVLAFLTAPDFESPLDFDTDNDYDIQVTVTDSGLLTGFKDLVITVMNVNEAPVAINDAISTDEDTVLNGDVTAANPTTADSDPEGGSLNVTHVNGNAANVGVQIGLGTGLLTVNANGTFNFDPNSGYESLGIGDSANEMFTYSIDDGSGTFNIMATVSITINGVNDTPVAKKR